jgi:uncharacterized protein YwgA
MNPKSTDHNNKLKSIIKGLFREHKHLHEYRLQNLIYLAELLHVERTDGNTLTPGDYTPYRYGAFSPCVKSTVEELSIHPKIKHKQSQRYDGNTQVYETTDLKPDLPSDIQALVDIVMSLTKHKSNDDLRDWSKSTYLFKNTNYNKEMEFTTYTDQLAEGKQPEWKKLT